MKFEFGDLYKFVVSLGVVLISLAVLAPWLFLKEPFDLFRSEAELKTVTQVARDAIHNRQEAVAFVLRFIPWFSGMAFACGVAFIYIGLKRWLANQVLLDEQTRIEVELKKTALRDATKDEIEASNERKADEQEAIPRATPPNRKINGAIYANIEAKVTRRLQEIYHNKFDVEANKMIGGVELDVLLRGKAMLTKDYIIEVKYIRRGFNYGWLKESFLKIIYARTIYSQLTNRLPNSVLLIVLDREAGEVEKYSSLVTRINDEALGRKGKDVIALLRKEELDSLSGEALQDRLGVYA
ncbi:hypothetical protein CHL79_25985 [Delftia acidovorans]|jgi:hypothetical protein|uniref:hypothetical protein n=1 Tax=Delftia acidovorans TaxID=80866 RepID=UPI000BC349CD|nr:hypothetical protein [Delftia acidovorans]ATH15622.1 hypothetical protein CHL79_25985 [Delftia acidovorans]